MLVLKLKSFPPPPSSLILFFRRCCWVRKVGKFSPENVSLFDFQFKAFHGIYKYFTFICSGRCWQNGKKMLRVVCWKSQMALMLNENQHIVVRKNFLSFNYERAHATWRQNIAQHKSMLKLFFLLNFSIKQTVRFDLPSNAQYVKGKKLWADSSCSNVIALGSKKEKRRREKQKKSFDEIEIWFKMSFEKF